MGINAIDGIRFNQVVQQETLPYFWTGIIYKIIRMYAVYYFQGHEIGLTDTRNDVNLYGQAIVQPWLVKLK